MTSISRVRFSSLLQGLRLTNRISFGLTRSYKRNDTPDPDLGLLRPESKPHKEKEIFPGEHGIERPKGKIYDKKPFKMSLETEKKYSWCSCGHSKNQPLCDGSHKKLDGTSFEKYRPKFRPIKFTVEESKDYWLCNCKQTSKAPFCDGTHKRNDIQEAIRS